MAAFDLDLDAIEVPTEISITFRLDGRVWSCKHPDAIPSTVADMLATGRVQIGPFFTAVLVDEDAADFLDLITRPGTPLTVGRLQVLMETLVEEMADRPTRRSASSQHGPRSTARTSEAGSSSAGTRRVRSAS